MKGISSLAALHLLCLMLCAPMFFIYIKDAGAVDFRTEQWTLIASAVIYGLIIVTNRPSTIYEGAIKFGLSTRILKCAFASVMFIMLSVPLFDNEDKAFSVIGLGCLLLSAAAFLLAVKSALSVKPSSSDLDK